MNGKGDKGGGFQKFDGMGGGKTDKPRTEKNAFKAEASFGGRAGGGVGAYLTAILMVTGNRMTNNRLEGKGVRGRKKRKSSMSSYCGESKENP